MNGSTIGERLGAPKHGYIPENKRGHYDRSVDREERRSLIVQYVKEHEGETVVVTEMMAAVGYKSIPGLRSMLDNLEREGRIKIDRSNRLRQKFYLTGSASKVAEQHLMEVAEAEKRKRAEAEKLAYALMDASAWEFLKQYDKLDNPNPVVLMRDFLDYMAGKTKE